MNYIEETLGLAVTVEPWGHMEKMPFFIADLYEIRKVTIGGTGTLFLYPKTELKQIDAVKKHIARIQKIELLPVAIELLTINRYRRDALIAARIPFVVPGKQLYLPFLGAVLQERFTTEVPEADQLQPSAQVLLFYYIYKKQQRLYTGQAVSDLGYSAMTITRAVKQLVQTGLFQEEKDGVQKILVGKWSMEELFEKARPFLINPVRKKVYVDKDELSGEYCTAGIDALAVRSMLNPSGLRCYAVDGKIQPKGTYTLMDAYTQAEVQLWKYDPRVLSDREEVDPLSLAMTFKDNPDERVEEAIEEMLEKFWGE